MGLRLLNIITACNGTDDEQLQKRLAERFPMLTVKPFDSGFKGIIGLVNQDCYFDSYEKDGELPEERYDELYEILYSVEVDIIPFSKEFPERRFVYMYVDCHGSVCSYEGFMVLNGEILFTHNEMNEGHIPLLQTLSPDYKEHHFEPFTRKFINTHTLSGL